MHVSSTCQQDRDKLESSEGSWNCSLSFQSQLSSRSLSSTNVALLLPPLPVHPSRSNTKVDPTVCLESQAVDSASPFFFVSGISWAVVCSAVGLLRCCFMVTPRGRGYERLTDSVAPQPLSVVLASAVSLEDATTRICMQQRMPSRLLCVVSTMRKAEQRVRYINS